MQLHAFLTAEKDGDALTALTLQKQPQSFCAVENQNISALPGIYADSLVFQSVAWWLY